MVEFAVVFPIVMLILLGGMEYARVFMTQQVLTNAVREAGRVGQVGNTSVNGTNYGSPQAAVAAVLASKSLGFIPSSRATVTYKNSSNTNNNIGLANATFTIAVDYRYDFVTPLGGMMRYFGAISPTTGFVLRARSTFKSEKYNDVY
jgi:Flp pilus assembly protein TadG